MVQPRHAPCPPLASGSHTWLAPQPSCGGPSKHTLQRFTAVSQTRLGGVAQSVEATHPTHVPRPPLPAVLQTGEPEVQPGSVEPEPSKQFLHDPMPPFDAESQISGAPQPALALQTMQPP